MKISAVFLFSLRERGPGTHAERCSNLVEDGVLPEG